MHFEVIGGQMEVMVWSVSYWNLKIHIDIGKTYPTKKKSASQLNLKCQTHPLQNIYLKFSILRSFDLLTRSNDLHFDFFHFHRTVHAKSFPQRCNMPMFLTVLWQSHKKSLRDFRSHWKSRTVNLKSKSVFNSQLGSILIQ